MKHRSTHIFILLAAMLVAAPQVSQELAALKSAASRHVKAAIINAFLNLQAGAATRPAAPVADSQLASCATSPEPAARKVAAPSRPATQVEVHARREVPAEAVEEAPAALAMLTDPASPIPEVASVQAEVLPAVAVKFDLHDLKGVRGRELAVLTPTGAEVAEARAAARREANEARKVAARRRKLEQAKPEAASVVWRFQNAEEFEGKMEMGVRGQLQSLGLLDIELRQTAPRPPARSLKLKRTAKPAPPAPPARPACPSSRQLACGPSGPELLFVGE